MTAPPTASETAPPPPTRTSPLHRWLRAKFGPTGWTWRTTVATLAATAILVTFVVALVWDTVALFAVAFALAMLALGMLKKDRYQQ